MIIGLNVTFSEVHPSMSDLADKSFRFSNGYVKLTFSNILSIDKNAFSSALQNFGHQLIGFSFAAPSHDRNWIMEDNCVVGSELLAEGGQSLECLDNQFKPALPSPCYGIVPIGMPIHIAAEPSGHVASIGPDHNVYSTQFVEFLKQANCIETSDVILKYQRHPGWHRISTKTSGRVLSRETLHCFNCQACRSERVGDHGVLVGNKNFEDGICTSDISIGHSLHSESLLISKTISRDLENCFEYGFALRPIVDENSSEGKTVIQITNVIYSQCF